MKCFFTLFYGLLIIWTGLLRGIEAKAYKPNALWFCMFMGFLAIFAGFLYRLEKRLLASVLGIITLSIVFSFYLKSFMTNPQEDATYRVGLIILASIAELVVILLPPKPINSTEIKPIELTSS